ncbi:MAG TPA: hypothetical protein VLD61_10985 [Methylomirabilota bacterium]|nr:hypothetical protein [Methylomirabilota bacterium]
MSQWDSRRIMLDPGRTMLALRSLRQPEGHYPFVDARRNRAIRPATATSMSGWRRAMSWFTTRPRPATAT